MPAPRNNLPARRRAALAPAYANQAAPGADLVGLLLGNLPSERTRAAYAYDLRQFFGTGNLTAAARIWLARPKGEAVGAALTWKADMMTRLAPATVARRLAALRSLVATARKLQQTELSVDDMPEPPRVEKYRDTSGPEYDRAVDLVDLVPGDTIKGKRDRAILSLLLMNALRRAEVASADRDNFDPDGPALWISGKGKQGQREAVTLAPETAAALADYLATRKDGNPALFVNHDNGHAPARLTGCGIYHIVRAYGLAHGLPHLAPHQLRHTAITAALDANNGNVRAVRLFSRHAKVETLLRYDDNRANVQGDITANLATRAATRRATRESVLL